MTMTACPGSYSPAAAEAVSVCEAAGGRAAPAAAVGRFCGRLPADPAPGPFFPVASVPGTGRTP
jgi:truncated hemoglobin YjbI